MENQSNINIRSRHFDDGLIEKTLVADESEAHKVISFEKNVLQKLNKLRTEESILADIESIDAFLKKYSSAFHAFKIYFYEKARKKDLEELTIVRISKTVLNSSCINNEKDLLCLMILMIKYGVKRDVLKTYIKTAKEFSPNAKKDGLFRCFDDEGNVINECIFVLESILRKAYNRFIQENDIKISFESITNILYKQDDKKKLKEAKSKRKVVVYEIDDLNPHAHTHASYSTEQEHSSYLDTNDNLRTKAINVTFDEVIEDIQKYDHLTPEQIIEYRSQYEDLLYVKNELDMLDNCLTVSNKTKLNLMKKSEVYQILLSKEYMSASLEEKIKILFAPRETEPQKVIENKPAFHGNKKANLIVFPSDDFIEQQIERITEGSNYKKDQIVNKLYKKIIMLRNLSTDILMGNDNFHNIQESLDGAIARRYGSGADKVIYVGIPMNLELKREVEKKYGYVPNYKVLLVFYLSDVKIESEEDMYTLVNNYVKTQDAVNMYREIKDIFNNPERKEELFALIESSNRQLKDMVEEKQTNKKK